VGQLSVLFFSVIKEKFQIVLLLTIASQAFGQSSMLSSGSWCKFSVTSEGVYKIDYSLLQKAGINPSQINPKNLRLYTGQPGMLPQPNSTARVVDLQEVAIAVVGEADEQFNSGDYILFYGQGPDTYNYDPKSNFISYQNNLYSDKNFYFLTVFASPGLRLAQSETLSGSFPVLTQFDDFAYYENDLYNLLHSGRQWFGEQFDQSLTLTIQFNLAGVVPNSNIKLTSHVMAQSITASSFNVSFNNNAILTQPIAPIPNTSYGVEGIIRIDTLSFNESLVAASVQPTQQIKYQFNKGGPGISIGYLDYLIFTMQRSLALYGNQTIFSSVPSTANPVSTFQISSIASTNLVWDVTQPFAVKNQVTQLNGNMFTFSVSTDTLKKFVVFDPAKLSTPNFESVVANQNIHSITSADLLIITYTPLLSQAVRLASFRQSHDQILPVVVTTDAVFNEYSGGKPDFTALRDFIRDVYKKSNSKLKFALLFGRGSYDYKNRVFANTNFVPIYESYESLDPLATYSSDDYFGFLQDNEGAWPENPAVNYSLDIGVGRVPVKNLSDATIVVDKLIDYETNTNRFGSWCNNFLFVADDGDFNIHESQADQLANTIEQTDPKFNANKLLLDSYEQTTTPIGPASPDASKALDLAVRKGMALVNYTGHGSEQVWTQQQILTPDLVQSWKNAPQYPLFVTATCEFGRNDDPSIISSAELAILQPKGGAIGLVTTARPVNSGTNFQLNQAFYQALFSKSNNAFRNLGFVMRDTKNNSLSGVSNRNFSLLGDPSMTLALPDNQVVVDQIKTLSGSDTLKGLSQVAISGEIQGSGLKLTGFNGTVDATLYDQLQSFVTNGNPGDTWNPPATPYNFVQRANVLFQGSVSVTQGSFQLSFVMPDNLVSGYGTGKLSLYAYATDGTTATGASTNFMVGGVESSPAPDTTPPAIRLFVSDTTFVNGGTVSSNTQLVALLSDNSGINTASVNPQNNIIATLDNKWNYIVNDYFIASKNNFTKGMIIYPLDTLKKGSHQLSLAASDTYNNRSTVSINFSVAGSGISINDFVNYPNPFHADRESTTFQFTNSRAGEDLEATLIIYDLTGRPLANIGYSIPSSTYQVDLGTWNGENIDGTKFSPGLYVARLSVRSLADGSQNEQSTKLIILN
jgi:hypothetical protein